MGHCYPRQSPELPPGMRAYDIVGPFGFSACCSTQLFPECDLLDVPCCRLDLDHVDMHDPLVGIPSPLTGLVERTTSIAFVTTLARVEPSSEGVGRRASQKEGVGLDGVVDGSLISVDMNL